MNKNILLERENRRKVYKNRISTDSIVEIRITFKGKDKEKLLQLQELFEDNKPQSTIRRVIKNFQIK